MNEEPKSESPEDDAEFQRVLGNLAKMPPAPHPKPQPGRKRGRSRKDDETVVGPNDP